MPAAVEAARRRCADQPWVSIREGAVPGDWPDGRFDLILFSEVLYFFTAADVAALAARAGESLLPGGEVMLVHWLGETDYPLSGDAAVETFLARADGFARPVRQVREAAYRIDVLRAGHPPTARG
ncbi:hypothetical protein MPOCJGCO_3833 [Methylobacterium trifolii]|uniref:Methyltransferase type 11 domain-containing protein n=1 Tax=Methylobacterium trifolii TaxID=1003092 RepID=A0ABQ4U6C5_9HYPH|nr:hypothetical protein MPOCJGCO_3833 [Methylobacterium trifolii]